MQPVECLSRIQFWPGIVPRQHRPGGNASTRHRLRQSQQYPLAFLRPQPKSFGVFFGEVSWSAGTGALLKWKGDPACCVRFVPAGSNQMNFHSVLRTLCLPKYPSRLTTKLLTTKLLADAFRTGLTRLSWDLKGNYQASAARRMIRCN
jgi:hypothetical protein